jgi:hypothetical protein
MGLLKRAMELLAVEKDSINGPHMIEYFAIIAAWVDEKDLACEQLAKAAQLSATASPVMAGSSSPLVGPAPRLPALRSYRHLARAAAVTPWPICKANPTQRVA